MIGYSSDENKVKREKKELVKIDQIKPSSSN